jgi:MFS family permease
MCGINETAYAGSKSPMFDSDRPPAVLRYYLYRASSHPGFHWPIYVLFLLRNGLTFTAIGAIASIQSVVVIAGEVPTGYVGDRIGRRNSLVIASVLFLVSNLAYLVATDFVGFTFVFVALSFGGTFVSGSGSAWLYDTLDEHHMEEEFTHISGRAGAVSNWAQTIAMLSGGVLYVVNPYYPFYAAVALSLVNLASVLSLPKNAQYADRAVPAETPTDETPTDETPTDAETDDESTDEPSETVSAASDDRLTVLEALPVVREQVSKSAIRSFIVYIALFGGALVTADIYIQPIAREALRTSIGATLAAWNVPEAATLGVLYASFTVVSAIVSDYAGDVEDRFGTRNTLLFVPLLMAALYLLPPLLPLLAFPMFFVMKGGLALVFPISSRYMNDRIDSVGRATVLSVVAMLRAVAGVPFRVGSGVLADYATPLVAVAALGALFVVGTVVLHVVAPPMRAAAGTGTPAD